MLVATKPANLNPWAAIVRAIRHGDVEETLQAIELCFWDIEPVGDALMMKRPGGDEHRVSVNGCSSCPGYAYRKRCTHKDAFELLMKYGEVRG